MRVIMPRALAAAVLSHRMPCSANLLVWNWREQSRVGEFHEKGYDKDTWPTLQWTSDESAAARLSGAQLQVFRDGEFSRVAQYLDTPVRTASMAPALPASASVSPCGGVAARPSESGVLHHVPRPGALPHGRVHAACQGSVCSPRSPRCTCTLTVNRCCNVGCTCLRGCVPSRPFRQSQGATEFLPVVQGVHVVGTGWWCRHC